MVRYNRVPGFVPVLLGLLIVTPLSLLRAQAPSAPRSYEGAAGGTRFIEEGQPPVMIHSLVEDTNRGRAAAEAHSVGAASTASDLSYHGGTGGIGVETAPKVYLVLWGSQWSNDPSGESGILSSFLNGVGGSSWFNSVTQYC